MSPQTLDKVVAVRGWARPTNLSNVKTFLGFVGYYGRVIKDLAKQVYSQKRRLSLGEAQENASSTLRKITAEPGLPGHFKDLYTRH